MNDQCIDVSIVIPAYNEEKRIGKSLNHLITYLDQKHLSFEIIVIDDGSSDGTLEVCKQKLGGVRHQILQNERNCGKGFSVRRGVHTAKGEHILFTDADLSAPIEELDKLMQALNDGCDVTIGSRAVESSDVQVHQNMIRENMGKTFNWIARLLTFRGIHDSQCGLKAFKREAAKKIFERQVINGFCFDAEVLFLAQRMGYRVAEIGVRWINSPQSKVRIFKDSFQMLIDLFRIRLLHLGKKY